MVAGAAALLMVTGGGAAGVAALTRQRPEQPRFVTSVGDAAVGESAVGDAAAGDAAAAGAAPERALPAPPAGKAQLGTDTARLRTAAEANRTATRNPTSGLAAAQPAQAAQPAAPPKAAPRAVANAPAVVPPAPPAPPVITTRIDTQIREIPFSTRTVHDQTLPLGTRQVQSRGAAGRLTVRYVVTLTGGRPTGRRLLDSTVTRRPAQQVVALGEQTDDQQFDDQQSGDQQSSGWQSGGWHGHRWGHRDECGLPFDLCGTLGRNVTCADGFDQRREDDDAIPDWADGAVEVGGGVRFTDAGFGVLSVGRC